MEIPGLGQATGARAPGAPKSRGELEGKRLGRGCQRGGGGLSTHVQGGRLAPPTPCLPHTTWAGPARPACRQLPSPANKRAGFILHYLPQRSLSF